eukprot:CAMPEP_0198300072 /NCGR_PEP_ID=MMETSP1449-20131203/46729_1 /TAXON_ID=420275 /ORGANISM="Attheya septentrionalis, Strain CCMP2084" /LENGTH=513 /DNA_ID=CAMNT_0044001787 /DNA_START=106 /DNA_END=1644 /DNA_ORIENTATION=-
MTKFGTKNRQDVIAIVGGSFSGLSLAKKAADAGFRVIIFERRHDSRGVWSTTEGSANTGSRLQIEHYVYCDLQNVPACSSCYPRGDEMQRFLDNKAKSLLDEGRVEIRYGCEVERLFEANDDSVGLEYTYTSGSDKMSETFSSVHVRTGTLSRPNRLYVPDLEENYKGRWCLGVANAIDQMPIALNSNVCIVGMGAFAIENAKRALEMGAKSVTLVARSESYVNPRWLMHHSSVSLLQPKNLFLSMENEERWKEIVDALRCTPKSNGYDLESRIVNYLDTDNYMFTSSAQSDWFYAALCFDAINIVRGTVIRAESSKTVIVRRPGDDDVTTAVPADVVILCTGHRCDTKLLSNIPLTATAFGMNGKLTHNLRLDTLPNPTLFGPRCPIPHFPALSYGMASDILDLVTLHAIRDKNFYRRWCHTFQLYQNPDQCFIESIDSRDWMKLFWKCFMSNGFPLLGCKLLGILYDRYEVCCAIERSGNGWYATVVADWKGYVADLHKWRQEQDVDQERW